MRVAVLADIGQPVYHVGDEAIGHAVHAALRARGVRPVMLTRDPRHTRTYFGPTDTAPALPFPMAPREHEARLDAIERYLDGQDTALASDDPARGFIATIRDVDAVLVAGGGNLNSEYGWLLYERLAAITVARHLGKPVVITGQTLGPALTHHDRALVGRALAECGLVSLREHHSVALGRDLVPGNDLVVGGLDDAAGWRSRITGPSPGTARVVATFAPVTRPGQREATAARLAQFLDEFASRADARVELLPHMAHPGRADGDVAFHDAIVAASTSGLLHPLPLPTATEGADAVAGADLVITSRYHPAVFGATRNVPVFALAPDSYADIRLDGALTHHGLGGWTIPVAALATGEASEALAAVWADHDRVAAHLGAHRDRLLRDHGRRWDDLVTALGGGAATPEPWQPAPPLSPPDAVASTRASHLPGLTAQADGLRAWLEEQRTASYRRAEKVSPAEPRDGGD